MLRLDEWTFALTGLTLVVVLFQLLMMSRQTRLMDRQTCIAEKQLIIIEKQDELLARRADLEVVALESVDANSVTLRFQVRNNGNQTARGFFWHLWLPHGVDQILSGRKPVHEVRGFRSFDGVNYREYADRIEDPVHVRRSVPFANIGIVRSQLSDVRIRWLLIADDGVFPPDKDGAENPGVIEIPPASAVSRGSSA